MSDVSLNPRQSRQLAALAQQGCIPNSALGCVELSFSPSQMVAAAASPYMLLTRTFEVETQRQDAVLVDGMLLADAVSVKISDDGVVVGGSLIPFWDGKFVDWRRWLDPVADFDVSGLMFDPALILTALRGQGLVERGVTVRLLPGRIGVSALLRIVSSDGFEALVMPKGGSDE